jgi:hypothetical protein
MEAAKIVNVEALIGWHGLCAGCNWGPLSEPFFELCTLSPAQRRLAADFSLVALSVPRSISHLSICISLSVFSHTHM